MRRIVQVVILVALVFLAIFVIRNRQSSSANNRAVLMIAEGRHQEAVQAIEEALRSKPNDARMLKNLGIAYDGLGETAKAQDAYERSLASDPSQQDVKERLSQSAPSEAMKDWAVNRYDLPREKIEVIPLPLGTAATIQRDSSAWEKGRVTFLGRLQPVKGIFEFLHAAIDVAPDAPDVDFEFIGGDTAYLAARNRSLLSMLQEIIPPELKRRFHFRGSLERHAIAGRLANTRIGVVPSRWENFPNAVIELMASGVPVLGTVTGGIPEIITDGKTGWLADSCTPEDLLAALQRALSTPPETLQEMGRAAADSVRDLCSNERVVRRHIEYKNRVAQAQQRSSIHLPANLPRANHSFQVVPARKNASIASDATGIAVAIPCYNQGSYLSDCLRSIEIQALPPAITIVVNDGSTDPSTLRHFAAFEKKGWRILHKTNGGLVSARNAGIRAILDSGLHPLGIVCIDSDDRLRPGFIQRCEQVLRNCPEVGVVSCWVQHFEVADRLWMQPCPAFPYQWTTNQVATFSAVRTEALLEVGLYQLEMHSGCYADWDLFNAVLAAGWVGVTIPEILGEYRVRDDSILRRLNAHAHGRMRRAMFQRFSEQVAADAVDVALLSEAADSWILRDEVFTLRAQVARARSFLKRPDRAVRWVVRKVINRARKTFARWNLS